MRRTLVAVLVALVVAAGCVNEGTGKEKSKAGSAKALRAATQAFADAAWAERALTSDDQHDHAKPLHHEGFSTPNFELLGHDPLISPDYGTTAFGHLCGDAKQTQDGRRIAAIESRSDVGFTLVDVTDPRKPTWLGELVMRRTYVYDLAVVPDGRYVVLVTTDIVQPDPRLDGERPVLDHMTMRSPCAPQGVALRWAAEDPVPRPLSLLLVDISNPMQPAIVDQRPLSGYGHSVFSTILDGRTWVLASVYLQNSGFSNYHFYEITQGRLSLLSIYVPAPDLGGPAQWTISLGHDDAWIHKHPGLGKTVAFLAHWHAGLILLDLTTPQTPRFLGRWSDYDPNRGAGDTGQTHSAFPLPALWDGRHYTIIAPEHPAKPASFPTGIVWVLDTTDPAAIVAVAAWTLPHEVAWTGRLMWSLHYLTVVNRTLLVSAYHAGIWAVDLSPIRSDNFTLLPTTGVFVPNLVSPKPPAKPLRWAPTLEEVLSFPDGTFVTFDSNSGAYTARFHDDTPMPAPDPWPIPAPRR